MKKRKDFTAEFKREAVRLMETSGKLPADLAKCNTAKLPGGPM